MVEILGGREVVIETGAIRWNCEAHQQPEDPMTEERMALIELLQKSEDADFLRAVAEGVLQMLMEADVEGLIGAGRHERSADRLNYRNGYRERDCRPSLRAYAPRPSTLEPGSRMTRPSPGFEGSTRLLHELGEQAYSEVVAAHRLVLRDAFAGRGSVEVDTQGDALFVASRAPPTRLPPRSTDRRRWW